MHNDFNFFPMILDLFEGEGGGTSGATAPAAGEQSGDLSKVVYGKQEGQPQTETPDTTQQSDADSVENRDKMYRDLIQGEYKDLYDQDVQRIVKNRLKGFDELKQTNSQQQDIIDRLAAKYGVTDLSEIAAAIDNDTAMWEAEADRAGMTTQQYMDYQALQRQNNALLRQESLRAEQAQREQQLQQWIQEGEALKQTFPNFDLKAEMENPNFFAMLQKGIPVGDAFKVMHFDDIQNFTAQTAAQQAEAAVTASVRANGKRPVENGTRTQSSFTVKSDVSKLNKNDRAEIARRVARGETITF